MKFMPVIDFEYYNVLFSVKEKQKSTVKEDSTVEKKKESTAKKDSTVEKKKESTAKKDSTVDKKQKRSTEGCSKFKSPETRQVQERLVSTLEHMQVPKWDRTKCPEE